MTDETETTKKPRTLLVALPLAITLALTGLFYVGLKSGDHSVIPSALIGHRAPATELPPLEGLGVPGLDSSKFMGNVTLVNVFSSWCGPCHEEHPVLLELAKDKRFSLSAINYKDRPEDARRFLASLGNPFEALGVDEKGRATIDWGVYGVPETFLVGRDGTIVYKHVGPVTPKALKERIMPQIEKALAAPAPSS
jgi:cytochrome c biogenesis protein CcmG/thiol:disulfide interchange protein DsbE